VHGVIHYSRQVCNLLFLAFQYSSPGDSTTAGEVCYLRLPCYLCQELLSFVIRRVCWFVCWLVRYACCDFSKTKSPIFMKFCTDVQHLCHISQISRQKAQNRRDEGLKWLIGAVVCLHNAPRVQLFARAGYECPHKSLWVSLRH